MNKICVYAIAKNEVHHVERWYNSMKEADYITVLDTGSTDGTVEKLRELGVNVKIKTYDFFRFDEARNDSLKLVPEEYNIRVCTDLDEVFNEGWADILRNEWVEGKHRRCTYRYIWSPNDNIEIDYDKIHDKGFSWRFPCHEWLWDDENGGYYPIEVSLDLRDKLLLRHYPDNHSRSFYLPLLELRAKENPDSDLTGKVYLAREYTFNGMWNECIELSKKTLAMNGLSKEDEFKMRLHLGDSLFFTGDLNGAEIEYLKLIQLRPKSRDGYVKMAMLLLDNRVHKPAIALAILLEGLETCEYGYSWVEDAELWTWKYYDWLCVAYYQLGDYQKAVKYAYKALKAEPDNQHIKENLMVSLEKMEE